MLRKPYFFLLNQLLSFALFAQTGPAGVGTSTNNVLWLKADAGTSSSTNNTAISFWNDQSGNAVNTTQTVSAQQPSFATNVLNGFPAIQFDNVNGANLNDKLIGPDSPLLDNTAGLSFFMVTRPQNVDNNARCILSKRTAVAVDQSFMQFFFTGSLFYTDIQTNNNRYNTVASFSANTNYIIDQFYDGNATAASRCRTYISGSLNVTASETNSLIPDNPSPLIVGSTDASDSRPYGGYLAETIIYRTALNDASRIIVDNYLSAKYNISLNSNDKYAGDDVANGDYDREVAGIGQESSGSNTSFSASISGGLSLAATAGLDNADYILAGHAVATNTTISTDIGGITGSAIARWQRVWYLDLTNTSTNITCNIEFDMSDGGMGTFTLGTTANYVLLYRAAQTGNWTEVSTASSITGDRILFNAITISADGYYTLGTKNFNASPLPIELTYFAANSEKEQVLISWTTASEKNSDKYSIERSADGIQFDLVKELKAAGNSKKIIEYQYADKKPLPGISYYRLKQSDFDKQFTYSKIVSVNRSNEDGLLTIYPNPSDGTFTLHLQNRYQQAFLLSLYNANGQFQYSLKGYTNARAEFYFEPLKKLSSGIYTLVITTEGEHFTEKLIIR